jgi:hypothetical protein
MYTNVRSPFGSALCDGKQTDRQKTRKLIVHRAYAIFISRESSAACTQFWVKLAEKVTCQSAAGNEDTRGTENKWEREGQNEQFFATERTLATDRVSSARLTPSRGCRGPLTGHNNARVANMDVINYVPCR